MIEEQHGEGDVPDHIPCSPAASQARQRSMGRDPVTRGFKGISPLNMHENVYLRLFQLVSL
jgi:hypothetical protein